MLDFLKTIFYGSASNDTASAKRKNKHGHRCYVEGLSKSELAVVSILASKLDSKKYFIFNNLIIPTKSGSSCQIDHLVIARTGVFVIESKDYSGWIFGDPDCRNWTATYITGNKHSFQNPVFQNLYHIKSLAENSPFVPESVFINLVSFSRRADFKTVLPQNIMYEDQLPEYILKYTEPILSTKEVLMLIGQVSYLCQATDIDLDTHIHNISK